MAMQGWTMNKAGQWVRARQGWTLATVLALCAPIAPPLAQARPAGLAPSSDISDDSDEPDALPYRQCVPFAREASGIQLYGDALTWWDQAQGHYARGREPKVGAVMSFRPHGAMTLGHVAMVSKVIDDRTVLLRHANWSPIDGRRGNVELDVRAVDVSPANDWSEVRVWYAPIGDLGTTHWPVNGFIYKHKPRPGEEQLAPRGTVLAAADTPRVTRLSYRTTAQRRIDSSFLAGIRPEPGTSPVVPQRTWLMAHVQTGAAAMAMTTAPARHDDPIGRIIAAHMKHAAD
jgi:surface antigen